MSHTATNCFEIIYLDFTRIRQCQTRTEFELRTFATATEITIAKILLQIQFENVRVNRVVNASTIYGLIE